MILEISRRKFGIGFSMQDWPKARHYIVRLGVREARVIVCEDQGPRAIGIAALLFAGIFLN